MMNEAPQGQLIECPNCVRTGKRQILGRVLDDGDLLVLRFHHGTTIIRSPRHELICGCGYGFTISFGTVIEQNILPSERSNA